jgi:pimeloyl-ACP methyl ester carboxylesterase
MALNTPKSNLAWTRGYSRRSLGSLPNIQSAWYSLNEVVQKGLIDTSAARSLLLDAHLVDMVWQVIWPEDFETPDDDLERRLRDVDGYVIFIHGWTGNHSIWEELPEMAVRANRRLIAISIDHNGFGQSRFAVDHPGLDTCCPPSAMNVVERLVNLLKIRRQPGEPNRKVINFVGHSMGGAALFYLNPMKWDIGEETRYALAPALLMNDSVHRTFFNALGLGISIVDRLRIFEPVENIIKPNMVEAVCEGSSDFVKQAHTVQYNETPRGTTAATFRAMGMLNNWEIAHKWDFFRIMLGHRDTLVGLAPMMDMLSGLEVPAGHVRVVAGSHYMFSVGRDTAFQHAQNRELVLEDILDLHDRALHLQKTGKPAKRGMTY